MTYYPQVTLTMWFRNIVVSEDYENPGGLFTPVGGKIGDLGPIAPCHCTVGYKFETLKDDQGEYYRNTVYRGYAVWGSDCLPSGNIRNAFLIIQPFRTHLDGQVEQWFGQKTIHAVVLGTTQWWKLPPDAQVVTDGPATFKCEDVTGNVMTAAFPPGGKGVGNMTSPFHLPLEHSYTSFGDDGSAEQINLNAYVIDVTEHVLEWQKTSKGNFGIILKGWNENLFVEGSNHEWWGTFMVTLEIEVHPGA